MSTSDHTLIPQRITRSVARTLAQSELSIPPGLVQVARPDIPPFSQQPSLSSLPVEIKLMIVHWVDRFERQDKRARIKRPWELDEFEFDRPGRSRSKIGKRNRNCDLGWTGKLNSTVDEPRVISPTKALAAVDRSFYHLCQPLIWELLDLQGGTVPKLRQLLAEILPLHRYHVRSLWWRASQSELKDWEQVDYYSPGEIQPRHSWEEETRNRLLLRILQVCPRLLQLDIDGDYKLNGPWPAESWMCRRLPRPPTGMFVEPILRLRGLKALSLTSSGHRMSFEEGWVVRLIREMLELQSFSCAGIQASQPFIRSEPPPPSPLGIHLASLTQLDTLSLSNANCVNSTWALLDWQGPLDSLSFDACPHLLSDVFHALAQRFAATLTQVRIGNVQMMGGFFQPRLGWNVFRPFDLPKLALLIFPSGTAGSRKFMKGFLSCKNLQKVQVGTRRLMDYQAFAELLEDKNWPNELTSNDSQLGYEDSSDGFYLDYPLEGDYFGEGGYNWEPSPISTDFGPVWSDYEYQDYYTL